MSLRKKIYERDDYRHLDEYLLRLLTEIVALTELYQVFEHTTKPLVDLLTTHSEGIWEDVKLSPLFYAGLAMKLRSRVIYENAPKHHIGH
jgi:hypothetical protein